MDVFCMETFAREREAGFTRFSVRCLLLAVLLFASSSLGALWAADIESDLEREARLARRGAGLRFGGWRVSGLDKSESLEDSRSPLFEGYFQKGLDLHLAWASNVGLWKRSQRFESPGGLTGETTSEKVDSYIVPLFTALKFHPMSQPKHSLQPFLDAGAGFALGIETRKTDDSGLVSGASTTTTNLGFGFRGGAGLEVWMGRMFGLSGQLRYQWIRFTQEMSTDDTFKGLAFDVGLLYRFQYSLASE